MLIDCLLAKHGIAIETGVLIVTSKKTQRTTKRQFLTHCCLI